MSPIKVKFVSRKISKVRFQPKNPTIFVTGSYDDESNNLCVWKFPDSTNMSEVIDINDDDPQVLSSCAFQGCVTDLQVLSNNLLLASSSLGSVSMLTYSDQNLRTMHTWESIHAFKTGTASTTAISVKGQDIVSAGEDGKICLLNFNLSQKVQEIEVSDLCTLTAVTYLRHQEIVAGNSLGCLRLWDLRSTVEKSRLLTLSRGQRGVSCLKVHPTQSHILASGYEDGSLCIWDMRQDCKPMSILEGHTATISELLFHPTNPDFLYTCSWDGSVWQWDSSNLRSSVSAYASAFGNQEPTPKGNPWLICDANKHKLDVMCLSRQIWSCVNSLDLSGSVLIWGTDNEELCIINDIAV